MSFNGRLHRDSMLCTEQHFRIAANYGVGDQVPPQGHARSGPGCFEKQKAEDGSSAISSAVISALRRADESSLFPRFRNRLRPASPNPRWLPGQLVPPAWRNRTGRHSAKGLFVYQRLGCRPPLLRFTQWAAGARSFFVNGRLSTLTFQRHLRAAAIFYPLSWPCRLFRG